MIKNSTTFYLKFGLKSHILVLCFTFGHICYHIFCIGSISFVSSGFPFALEGPWTEPLFHVVFMGSQDSSAVSPELAPFSLIAHHFDIVHVHPFYTIMGWFCCWGLWGRGLGPVNSPDWWSNMAICTRLATKCDTQIGWVV